MGTRLRVRFLEVAGTAEMVVVAGTVETAAVGMVDMAEWDGGIGLLRLRGRRVRALQGMFR